MTENPDGVFAFMKLNPAVHVLTKLRNRDLRRRVFRQTQRLSLEFHESYTSGRIISRQTSDLEAVHAFKAAKILFAPGKAANAGGVAAAAHEDEAAHAHDPAGGIDEGSAGVPHVDRRVGLKKFLKRRGIGRFAVGLRDDSGSDGLRQTEWRADCQNP